MSGSIPVFVQLAFGLGAGSRLSLVSLLVETPTRSYREIKMIYLGIYCDWKLNAVYLSRQSTCQFQSRVIKITRGFCPANTLIGFRVLLSAASTGKPCNSLLPLFCNKTYTI